MMNFKSPYDSNQIREGLMNIKQSQMELLKQLKDQNHILKKYTPSDPIFQEKNESNIYQSSQGYSLKQNLQSNVGSNQKGAYGNSYLSNNQKDFQDNLKVNSAMKNQNNSILQRQLETITQDFHRMKKNYFTEKQKNKDMILHMQFAASLHNIILKDVLQGNNLQSIKVKVRGQVQSYQSEFPEFKAFGLEQAFNIVNLQSDGVYIESKASNNNRRTSIFPAPKSQNLIQNNQLLKQLNDLKCQLKQLSLEKQRKSQLVTLMRGQNQYTISLLNKQIQMKDEKINDLVSEIIRQKQSMKLFSIQNNDLRSNIQRLKSQLQRNLNKIQSLESIQRKTNQTIEKQHKYMKYLKQLEQKISFYQKQTKQKSKLIEIHQQNINKTNQLFRSLKTQNQKIHQEIQQLTQTNQARNQNNSQLQDKIQKLQAKYSDQIKVINKRNQSEQSSLKQHVEELKKSVQQLLLQEQSYKQSENTLQQLKYRKIQTIKFSKTIDHLWKIKEVEYENINQVLTQLNLIKSNLIENRFHSNPNLPNHNNKLFKESKSSKSKPKSSSRSKSKQMHRKT